MRSDDGGPAFPQRPWFESGRVDWPHEFGVEGLSKRELFAAMAMQALLPRMGNAQTRSEYPYLEEEQIAPLSVCMADYLLAALKETHDAK